MSASRHQLLSEAKALLKAERGAVFKQGALGVALCYPSPYRVAMSSLGFQTIYRKINELPFAFAERAFLPDDEALVRRLRMPLFSLETQRPVAEFSILAFSVAYELELTGVLSMLALSGLALRSSERPEHAPLVVAGGPLSFSNAAPLEPFVDVLVQGEGEGLIEVLLGVCEAHIAKHEVLSILAKHPGFFVPGISVAQRRFDICKAEDAQLPAYSQVVTPNTELSSMFLVETGRGCSRGCHYCVMRRTTNGGLRLVSKQRILESIPPWAKRIGFVGAAVTDHPHLLELLEESTLAGREVGVSSLRADRLSLRLTQALRAGGAQILTVAMDGASQRLRNLLERRHTEEHILQAALWAKACGMHHLKLYVMLGLPTEEAADIEELACLVVALSKQLPVVLGIAPFVAKRHTPMDGAPFAGIAELENRLRLLRARLRGKAQLRCTSPRWAFIEYMLAQCGPEAGLAAMEAWEKGGKFAHWSAAFDEHALKPFLACRTTEPSAAAWPKVGC
ncbi:MAG: B12-binding domain-containing radical SAM protein [Proteobacteria bacterium]|nr:B12-binding domain-containing radical SAM protein [Cystobacterineae bacterium]MCL2258704.1 B12-binding domain-containing radical SAM protein [Cystobacterineae bacterium]MCL2314994.1 B12-binding domain-containing radical SAM protein [Pseudomonadota bacterium]